MTVVGIRALKQNASAVVAEATTGQTITITDHGRPVAQMTAIPTSPLQALIDSGAARAARRDFRELPAPLPGPSLSAEILSMRLDERF